MSTTSSSRFLIGLLLAVFVALCFLFAPFLSVFVITVVLGTLFAPLNKNLRKRFGPNASAFFTVSLVVVVVSAILTFVLGQVIREAGDALVGLQSGEIVPDRVLALLQARINETFPAANVDVVAMFKSALAWFVGQTGSIFQSIATVLLNMFLSMMALFYWFKDSDRLHEETLRVIPLSKADATGILDRLTVAVHSLVKGTLILALIQGTLAGIGFAIFDVPNPFLWASITVVCALVPTLGTSITFIPIVAYLALSGNTFSAVAIALWGALAVGLIDNVLGPRILSRGSNMHPMFTLLAVLGGVQLFGPIGLFAGPILVSLFFAVCKTYTMSQEKVV